MENIEKIYEVALYTILPRVKNLEEAEDIVQQAMIIYYRENRDVRYPKAFIIKICDNLIKKQKYKEQREISLIEKLYEERDETVTIESELKNEMEKSGLSLDEISNILSEDDKKLLNDYLNENTTIKNYAAKLKINYNTLNSRIYKIVSFLRAERLIREGVLKSPNLMNVNQKKALFRFLDRFKKEIRKHNIAWLQKYIPGETAEVYNPDIKIKQIVEYDFIKKDDVYTMDVFFKNDNDEFELFYFDFILIENRIQITKPPQKPKIAFWAPPEKEIMKEYVLLKGSDEKIEEYQGHVLDEYELENLAGIKNKFTDLIKELEAIDVLDYNSLFITDLRKKERLFQIYKVCNEAFEQGYVLNSENLAHGFATTMRTIQRDINSLEDQGIILPAERFGKKSDEWEKTNQYLDIRKNIITGFFSGDALDKIQRKNRFDIYLYLRTLYFFYIAHNDINLLPKKLSKPFIEMLLKIDHILSGAMADLRYKYLGDIFGKK